MKIKKILIALTVVIVFIAGVASVALYKIGDMVFDEVIDTQIAELEQTIADPAAETPAPIAKDPIPSTTSTTAQPEDKTDAVISVTKEKLEEVKDSVAPTDKMSAAKLVLNKLSQSDISNLTKLAAGGITPEEKEEVKAIVYSRFTPEEIEEIKALYIKYMQ